MEAGSWSKWANQCSMLFPEEISCAHTEKISSRMEFYSLKVTVEEGSISALAWKKSAINAFVKNCLEANIRAYPWDRYKPLSPANLINSTSQGLSPSTLRNFCGVLDVGGVLPHRLVGGVDDGWRLRLRRHWRSSTDDVRVGVVAEAVATFVKGLSAQPTQGWNWIKYY